MTEPTKQNRALNAQQSIEIFIEVSGMSYDDAIKPESAAKWEFFCAKSAPYSFEREYEEDSNLCDEGVTKEKTSQNLKLSMEGKARLLDKSTQYLHKNESKLDNILIKIVDKLYSEVSHTKTYIGEFATETLEFGREAGEKVSYSLEGSAGKYKEDIKEVPEL